MKNIKIEVRKPNYIVVTADTKRFGLNEVMFEGNTFDQCFDYCKRVMKRDTLQLSSYIIMGTYTDCTGRTFPVEMIVH